MRPQNRYKLPGMRRILRPTIGIALAIAAWTLPLCGVGAADLEVATVAGEEASAETTPAADPVADVLTVLPIQTEAMSAARTSTIPEPVSLAVFGTGLLLVLRRRRS